MFPGGIARVTRVLKLWIAGLLRGDGCIQGEIAICKGLQVLQFRIARFQSSVVDPHQHDADPDPAK